MIERAFRLLLHHPAVRALVAACDREGTVDCHLVGGVLDTLSRSPARKKTYDCVSCLNRRHMLWAWTSLCAVGFADLYVRLCSMGVWSDVRIF